MITKNRDGKFAEFWRLNDKAAARVAKWHHWMIDREEMANHNKLTVAIESPYAGDVAANVEYAKRCMLRELLDGQAPFASHVLYTLVLDDLAPEERKLGIEAGISMSKGCDIIAFYVDRGFSGGMMRALEIYMPYSEWWDKVRFNSLNRKKDISFTEIVARAYALSGHLICSKCGQFLKDHHDFYCRGVRERSLFDGPMIDLGSFQIAR